MHPTHYQHEGALVKNSFRAGQFTEELIVDENNKVVGTVRIKPNAILWKPKGTGGAKPFYAVPLQRFADWITDPDTKARRNKN